MCAQLVPSAERKPRISVIQWIGLAVLGLLLLDQLGLLRLGNPATLPRALVAMVPFLVVMVLAVTVHEFSHALVATLMGDDLPRRLGRLTLNPLKHLDPIGSVLFLVAHFGWGKPVPINPNAMRNPGLGWALSSVAGPVSNLIVATATVALLGLVGFSLDLPTILGVPPELFIADLIRVNVVLAVFNLLPVPPLDGFGFVYGLSPAPFRRLLAPLQRYGPFILLGLIFLPQFVPEFPPVLSLAVNAGTGAVYELLGLRSPRI